MIEVRLKLAATLAGVCLLCAAVADEPKDRSTKKGKVVGTLTARGENWIEVKADGEDRGRRYVPHWRGGLPKDGGGLDRKMLAQFKKLKIGSRLRLEWAFEERYRVEKIEVLKTPTDRKSGAKN